MPQAHIQCAAMRKALPFLMVLTSLLACDRQIGYIHSPKDFTSLDRKAIARVQQMPLGRIELLNSIAADYTDEEAPTLDACDYEVEKIVRREIEGKYPEEIEVICTTSSKESRLLRFVWVFDPQLERISEFRFGFDPSEFDAL